MSLNDDETPQATISLLSACVPIIATAASIDAIERWPPKNDEFARRSTLALSTGSCASASPILRESTSGSRSAAIRRWTTRGIVGSSTLPAAMSLMKLGRRTAPSAGFGARSFFIGSSVYAGVYATVGRPPPSSAPPLRAFGAMLEAHRHLRPAAARIVLAAPELAAAFARRPLDELDAAARAGRPPPVAVEGDAQQRVLLLRIAAGDQAKQPVDVVQADAVGVGELARVGAEVGGRHELAARDAVLRHHAAQLADFANADLLPHPLLALDDADRRIAARVMHRIEPDVDAAVGAVRLRPRLEAGLREQRLDDRLEAAPLDQLEDLARPAVGAAGAAAIRGEFAASRAGRPAGSSAMRPARTSRAAIARGRRSRSASKPVARAGGSWRQGMARLQSRGDTMVGSGGRACAFASRAA